MSEALTIGEINKIAIQEIPIVQAVYEKSKDTVAVTSEISKKVGVFVIGAALLITACTESESKHDAGWEPDAPGNIETAATDGNAAAPRQRRSTTNDGGDGSIAYIAVSVQHNPQVNPEQPNPKYWTHILGPITWAVCKGNDEEKVLSEANRRCEATALRLKNQSLGQTPPSTRCDIQATGQRRMSAAPVFCTVVAGGGVVVGSCGRTEDEALKLGMKKCREESVLLIHEPPLCVEQLDNPYEANDRMPMVVCSQPRH